MGFGSTFMCRFGNRKLTKFQSHNYCFLYQVENGKNGSGISGLESKKKDCFLSSKGGWKEVKKLKFITCLLRTYMKINVLFTLSHLVLEIK